MVWLILVYEEADIYIYIPRQINYNNKRKDKNSINYDETNNRNTWNSNATLSSILIDVVST
jgi:hypothetical protein